MGEAIQANRSHRGSRTFLRRGPWGTDHWEISWSGADVEVVQRCPLLIEQHHRLATPVEALAFVASEIENRCTEGYLEGRLQIPDGLRSAPRWHAVRSAPDDLERRLDLGQWLSDRGDLHGDLILDCAQPRSKTSVLTRDFHESTFHGWSAEWFRATWGGGFLQSLGLQVSPTELGSDFDAQLREVLALPWAWLIRSLFFFDLLPEDVPWLVERLCEAGPHPALRELTIVGRHAPTVVEEDLSELWAQTPHLQHLDVGIDGPLGALPTTVTTLHLRGTTLPEDLLHSLSGNRLRGLHLGRTEALDTGLHWTLLGLPACSELEALSFPPGWRDPERALPLRKPFPWDGTLTHLEVPIEHVAELLRDPSRWTQLHTLAVTAAFGFQTLAHVATPQSLIKLAGLGATAQARVMALTLTTAMPVALSLHRVVRSVPFAPYTSESAFDALTLRHGHLDAWWEVDWVDEDNNDVFRFVGPASLWWSLRWGREGQRWWEGIVPEVDWPHVHDGWGPWDGLLLDPYREPGEGARDRAPSWLVELWPEPDAEDIGWPRTPVHACPGEIADFEEPYRKAEPDFPIGWIRFPVALTVLWEMLDRRPEPS